MGRTLPRIDDGGAREAPVSRRAARALWPTVLRGPPRSQAECRHTHQVVVCVLLRVIFFPSSS
jgi:hypothetical protein